MSINSHSHFASLFPSLHKSRAITHLGTTFLSAALLGAAAAIAQPAYAQQALYAAYESGGANSTGFIEEYSSNGVGTLFASGGLLDDPTALAFYGGNLYVANSAGGHVASIVEFNRSGVGTLFASGGLLNEPTGMAFDSSSNLYVANFGGAGIDEFNSSGGRTLSSAVVA